MKTITNDKSTHSHFRITGIHLLVISVPVLQIPDQFIPHTVQPRITQTEIHLPVRPGAA
jgi:hypothetical protein